MNTTPSPTGMAVSAKKSLLAIVATPRKQGQAPSGRTPDREQGFSLAEERRTVRKCPAAKMSAARIRARMPRRAGAPGSLALHLPAELGEH